MYNHFFFSDNKPTKVLKTIFFNNYHVFGFCFENKVTWELLVMKYDINFMSNESRLRDLKILKEKNNSQ